MRHRKAGRRLGRDAAHRKALFRNLVTDLVKHERIHTTEAKAKEVRRFVERVITLARNAPTPEAIDGLDADAQALAKAQRVHAIRRARRWVQDHATLDKLFADVGPRYAERPGGYTRVIKTGYRDGDNAPMALIELVGAADAPVEAPAAGVEE